MAEEYAISYADLSEIEGALKQIGSGISNVISGINILDGRQNQLENELVQLDKKFSDFVEADLKFKNLQLAETRVGNLRQELQIKFGYYAEIRRMATGILQGVDTGVVSNETIKSTTEEVMIKAPGYWLAPALVSVAAWLRNDKSTCDKALFECLKRDDYKSTLFFMLLMRRLGRNEASLSWLERYFAHQDPKDLDREFITVLEAITTGVFHPASRALMMKNINKWIEQLTQTDNFVNEQKKQWLKYFESKKPTLAVDKFPFLKQFAKNWNLLEQSLCESKTHLILQNHFSSIISSSNDFSSSVKSKLDEILNLLVTNFDDEELPLQKQVRLNQLIIEKEGDKKAAKAVMDAEENIFKEKVDFLQILTNAAFNAEATGVTKVTQALALSINQPWIIESYDTFTAQCRSRFPQTIELEIDGFNTTTKNGSDENEQIEKQADYYNSELMKALSLIPFPIAGVIIGALIAIVGFIFGWEVGIITLAIGGVMIWNNINNVNKKKNQIKNTFKEREKNAKGVLRGCLAETVDYRIELGVEDSNAEKLREFLNSITPQAFSSVSKESARNII